MESRLGDWTNPTPPPKARHKAIGIMRQRPLPSLKEMLLLASVLQTAKPTSKTRQTQPLLCRRAARAAGCIISTTSNNLPAA